MSTKENMRHRFVSFDTSGFIFAGKFLLAVFLVFSVTQQVIAMSGLNFDTDALTATANSSLSDTQPKKISHDIEERVHEKTETMQARLAVHSVGTTAADTLNKARERFVAVDLENKEVRLFLKGNATATYPIITLGERGTPYEIPTGLFSVEEKSEGRVTSDNIHLPSTVRFFNNFYIHGEPYDSAGISVSSEYAHNYIGLSRDAARSVFEFVEEGTPIFVLRDNTDSETLIVPTHSLPHVSAKSFIVADIQSGTILAEKNADTVLPIASLSKLVTAIVAHETIPPQHMLSISYEDREKTEGTPGTLPEGTSLTVREILYPLLIESNNSLAYTLARYFGAQNFVMWMNAKAQNIGMKNTYFEDPSGISQKNRSTARDLFLLAQYIHDTQSYILNISRETEHTIPTPDGKVRELRNLNMFAETEGFVGGKTGYTDAARETMITVFDIDFGNDMRPVAIIVLSSEDRKSDVSKLLKWAQSF